MRQTEHHRSGISAPESRVVVASNGASILPGLTPTLPGLTGAAGTGRLPALPRHTRTKRCVRDRRRRTGCIASGRGCVPRPGRGVARQLLPFTANRRQSPEARFCRLDVRCRPLKPVPENATSVDDVFARASACHRSASAIPDACPLVPGRNRQAVFTESDMSFAAPGLPARIPPCWLAGLGPLHAPGVDIAVVGARTTRQGPGRRQKSHPVCATVPPGSPQGLQLFHRVDDRGSLGGTRRHWKRGAGMFWMASVTTGRSVL